MQENSNTWRLRTHREYSAELYILYTCAQVPSDVRISYMLLQENEMAVSARTNMLPKKAF